MNNLILYEPTAGQTRKVAKFLQGEFEKLNHKITISNVTIDPQHTGGFDAILIDASMHLKKYQTSVMHYIREHIQTINSAYSAFFSVSLTAASDDIESWVELEIITQKFLTAVGWKPKRVEYGMVRFPM